MNSLEALLKMHTSLERIRAGDTTTMSLQVDLNAAHNLTLTYITAAKMAASTQLSTHSRRERSVQTT